jgi:hypothetical protein
MAMHSPTDTSSRPSKEMSSACPVISRSVASVRCLAARGPVSPGASSSTSSASASSASPARIAIAGPNTFQEVGRWRRSSSPSIRSSWSREKLWTSSTATAPGSATSASAATASAESTASAGRTALPPLPAIALPSASTQPRW